MTTMHATLKDVESRAREILEEVRSVRRGRVGFADERPDVAIDRLGRLLLAHASASGLSIEEVSRKALSAAKALRSATGMTSEDIALVERAGFRVGDVNEMVQRQRRQKRMARGGRGAPLSLEEAEELRRRGFDPALIERAHEIGSVEDFRRIAAEVEGAR